MAAQPITASKPGRPALIALIGVGGAVDADTASPLAEDLERAIDSGATRVVVDLQRSESFGTLGLNALLQARQRLLVGGGGSIAIVLPPRLRRLFGLLRLDRRFLLAADRLQALQQLGVVAERTSNTPRARAA